MNGKAKEDLGQPTRDIRDRPFTLDFSYTESLQQIKLARRTLEMTRREALFVEYQQISNGLSLAGHFAPEVQDRDDFACCKMLDIVEANYRVSVASLVLCNLMSTVKGRGIHRQGP